MQSAGITAYEVAIVADWLGVLVHMLSSCHGWIETAVAASAVEACINRDRHLSRDRVFRVLLACPSS